MSAVTYSLCSMGKASLYSWMHLHTAERSASVGSLLSNITFATAIPLCKLILFCSVPASTWSGFRREWSRKDADFGRRNELAGFSQAHGGEICQCQRSSVFSMNEWIGPFKELLCKRFWLHRMHHCQVEFVVVVVHIRNVLAYFLLQQSLHTAPHPRHHTKLSALYPRSERWERIWLHTYSASSWLKSIKRIKCSSGMELQTNFIIIDKFSMLQRF